MLPSDRFIEEIGLMFQATGDTRISGRIFGLLVIEGREMSLGEMSQRLNVSRASVSTNARQLAKRGVLRRTAHPGDRQDFYEMKDFPSIDMLREMAERALRQSQAIQAFVEPIKEHNSSAADRVALFSGALGRSAKLLTDWAETLRNDETARKDQE